MAFDINVFNSRDLPGDCLVAPLRAYHSFFTEKIGNSASVTKVALMIAYVVTGIFAYPLFGLLALIGMPIKKSGVQALLDHNQQQIDTLKAQETALGVEESRYATKTSSNLQNRHLYRTFVVTHDTKAEVYKAATAFIEHFSRSLVKIYAEFSGEINVKKRTGQITITMYTDYDLNIAL